MKATTVFLIAVLINLSIFLITSALYFRNDDKNRSAPTWTLLLFGNISSSTSKPSTKLKRTMDASTNRCIGMSISGKYSSLESEVSHFFHNQYHRFVHSTNFSSVKLCWFPSQYTKNFFKPIWMSVPSRMATTCRSVLHFWEDQKVGRQLVLKQIPTLWCWTTSPTLPFLFMTLQRELKIHLWSMISE